MAFTLRVYAHLFEEQRLEAAIGLDDFLGASGSVSVLVPVEAA